MKKYITTGVLLVSLLGMLTGCGGSDGIDKDKAVQIALEDAKLTESEVIHLYVAQDKENGEDTYEVKFSNGDTEYEYEILASDGKIIKADYDRLLDEKDNGETQTFPQKQDKPTQGNNNTNNTNNTNKTPADDKISREEAAKLALDRVPGATAKDLKMERDYDDGKYKYEGEIIYDGKEYDFEIDAVTGNFLEWSEEKR